MSSIETTPIKLVVFDLGGTVVDHGCMAPVVALIEGFRQFDIAVTTDQVRGPMGLHKRDHIRELFQLPDVARQWSDRYARPWTEDDVQRMFERFTPMQAEIARQHADLIPGVLECAEALRAAGIFIAVTTGYPRSVTTGILEAAANQGFAPDFSVCSDEVPAGRPAPWMIHRCMEATGVYPPTAVVKVGDTVPDIQAARNAGVWAIGVTSSSSEIGLTYDEFQSLSDDERAAKHNLVANKLSSGGAHRVIRSLAEFPKTIRDSSFQN